MTSPLLPSTVPVGSRIHNRYQVLAYLGGGENGQVYRVLDERQRIEVALKLLDPRRRPPSGWWVEAETLTTLRGDYILPILNADDEAGVPFIVTEIMDNGSTAERSVPSVGVPVNQAATWVQQACIGVARIHDRRILHTDIKPANLFLDRDDNVLVGDFGLACPMDASGNGHAAGSPETLAPDVVTSMATNARTDVYSLGATLYELIAGHWLNPAISHLNGPTVYPIVGAHSPNPIGNVAPHVPQGLRAVIMRAVDPDPANRYATPDELAAAIGARTIPRRDWTRTTPCLGHFMCFTGSRHGANTYQVCAVPTGTRDRHRIEAYRTPSRRRLLPWPEVTKAQLMSKLRSRLIELI